MGSDNRLATPWLRTQLIEALRLIADEHWLVAAVDSRGAGSDALNSVLDLLDDTGAGDEPESHAGAFYREAEVGHARSLSHARDSALGTEVSC
ncbi:hypothetical protein [Nocardioides astragali]|uniref:Uncharacterized protein n=1 Tax=Nocardioides astragali TaxID=1776736 RepID=A0ABW2MV46_9ACTN|nr:hypothetical protein [Nocardioides astragali]